MCLQVCAFVRVRHVCAFVRVFYVCVRYVCVCVRVFVSVCVCECVYVCVCNSSEILGIYGSNSHTSVCIGDEWCNFPAGEGVQRRKLQ